MIERFEERDRERVNDERRQERVCSNVMLVLNTIYGEKIGFVYRND